MIKYKIYITETWYPQIIIEDKYDYDKNWNFTFLSTEINNLSADKKYLNEVVQELEEVVAWTRDDCIFWFETTLIFCYQKWKWYYWKLYPNTEVTITYDYWDEELITDLKVEEILKMMTEWRDYINAWEKETGKIKK